MKKKNNINLGRYLFNTRYKNIFMNKTINIKIIIQLPRSAHLLQIYQNSLGNPILKHNHIAKIFYITPRLGTTSIGTITE